MSRLKIGKAHDAGFGRPSAVRMPCAAQKACPSLPTPDLNHIAHHDGLSVVLQAQIIVLFAG